MHALHVSVLQKVALLFSALGTEYCYLLILPLVYWLFDRKTGARLGILLLASVLLNDLAKVAFHLPRPFQVDPTLMIIPAAMERSFGFPSGHAQGAFLVWPFLALQTRDKFKWLPIAYALACCILLSRLILGVHWPLDVVGGALIGSTMLFIYQHYGDFMERGFRGQTLINQAIATIIFVALCWGLGTFLIFKSVQAIGPTNAALVRAPLDLVGRCAALLGLVIGLVFAPRDVLAGGTTVQKVGRTVVGLVGVVIFYVGIKVVSEDIIANFIRYFLTTFWVTCASLWVFRALRLGGSDIQPRILAAD
ncbi:hypothetical protein IAD21_00100 [Abditibacteriota bacterium]|nr:hypothetical protein IAD21_00100 [Abditibacteriota bacterium]